MLLTDFKQKIKESSIVITYFSALHCNVCKVLRPKIKDLAAQFEEIDFIYLDTEQHKEICGQYSIFTIPTIIIYIEGKESKRLSRNFSLAELENYLSRMITLMKD